ncbi:MAG: tetratricopeptide repeat protein [Pseudomonadota bacterium]
MKKEIDHPNRFHRRAALAICLLGILIYSNTLNCGFVFDDQQNITENQYIRLTDLGLEKLTAAAFKSPMPNRPVANISFAVNYYLGKYNVAGYHLVNILIHLINGILVYVLTGMTLRHSGLPGSKTSRIPDAGIALVSLFAALFFTAHPIQVQSVTYIVQRMNSLAAMFYLLALILYIGARSADIRWKQWALGAGCLTSWIFALASKEIAATLPLVLLLYEWYFFRDLATDRLKHHLKYFPGLIAVLGMVAYVYLGTHPLDKILGSYASRDFTMGARVLTQFRVLVFYLSLLLYPNPSRLNLLHQITPSHSLFDPISTFFSLLILTGLLILAVYFAKRQRLISFGILWFFIHLMIESSIFGLELVFEHRLYLPMFGLALIAAYLLFYLLAANRTRALVVAIAIIFSLGTATYLRNSAWQDPITLWSDVVSKSPQSPRAHYNLGSDLDRLGNLEAAVYHLSEALKIKPDHTRAHNNLGQVLFKQGKIDQAAGHFSEALRIEPGNAAARYNLGLAMEEKGNLAAAANHYRQALRIKPDFAEAHNSLGIVLQGQENLKEAVDHFSEALNINPDYAEAHHNMGSALEMQGHFKQAIDHYFTALRIRPDDAQTYINLGVVLTRQGILDQAVHSYLEALRIKPDDAGAHNNLGVVLQRQGKSKAAIEHYLQAIKINPDYAEAHNNLGIALARQGRFKEAVHYFSEALRIQPGDTQARHNLELGLREMNPSTKGKDTTNP